MATIKNTDGVLTPPACYASEQERCEAYVAKILSPEPVGRAPREGLEGSADRAYGAPEQPVAAAAGGEEEHGDQGEPGAQEQPTMAGQETQHVPSLPPALRRAGRKR